MFATTPNVVRAVSPHAIDDQVSGLVRQYIRLQQLRVGAMRPLLRARSFRSIDSRKVSVVPGSGPTYGGCISRRMSFSMLRLVICFEYLGRACARRRPAVHPTRSKRG